ncbi:MAG: hypothetical protein IKL62_06675 [Clostridia bacterium]|nr:hypothetical protein [Clostridia bacterium]
MKKLLAVLMALVLMLSMLTLMAGCGDDEKKDDDGENITQNVDDDDDKEDGEKEDEEPDDDDEEGDFYGVWVPKNAYIDGDEDDDALYDMGAYLGLREDGMLIMILEDGRGALYDYKIKKGVLEISYEGEEISEMDIAVKGDHLTIEYTELGQDVEIVMKRFDYPARKEIVGEWIWESQDGDGFTAPTEFKSNGEFTVDDEEEFIEGEWDYSDGMLTLDYDQSETYYFVTIEGDKMTHITASDKGLHKMIYYRED